MGNPTGRLIGRCGHKWEDDTFYRNKMWTGLCLRIGGLESWGSIQFRISCLPVSYQKSKDQVSFFLCQTLAVTLQEIEWQCLWTGYWGEYLDVIVENIS
jgi:hypothetical protein